MTFGKALHLLICGLTNKKQLVT